MTNKRLSDYEKALQLTKTMPQFYLGQEVQTKDGTGIIVSSEMRWNGLYIEPNTSLAVVWYSTNTPANNWVSSTYKLTEITVPKERIKT